MVLNYPGAGWLVVYETTTISFVLERAIGWDGTETNGEWARCDDGEGGLGKDVGRGDGGLDGQWSEGERDA
jgi:hypothetical protein